MREELEGLLRESLIKLSPDIKRRDKREKGLPGDNIKRGVVPAAAWFHVGLKKGGKENKLRVKVKRKGYQEGPFQGFTVVEPFSALRGGIDIGRGC